MPRYYCDYCDTYLTHDSPSVRKQHNAGYKHKANVREYYQQYETQQNQYLIDQKIKEHFQQVGATYNQMRPRLPVLPNPMVPMPGNPQLGVNSPFVPGMRPPILPRPLPVTSGYVSAPGMPPMAAVPPPGAPSLPGPPRSMTMNPPTMVPGSTSTSSGAPPMFTLPMYQANPAAPTSGGLNSSGMNPQSQSSEASH